jgi:RNA polymerase sigma factor (sigma-70 family)
MEDDGSLAARFETQRAHLRGVAYRMLGSLSEADDAVQEAWLRLSRADTGAVENLGGWLTTVIARVCLDMLRSRKARSEEPLADGAAEPITGDPSGDPESEALMADAVGLAVLVVLETLAPAERLAFVLHDMFGQSFEEIAPIVGRSPAAARQLASRARRRLQGTDASSAPDLARQRDVVNAFLAALRGADFEALVALLDPDVVFRAEGAGGDPRAVSEVRGARTWAKGALAFSRSVRDMRRALVNGAPGVVLAPRGKLARALVFTIENDKIVRVEVIADPERLRTLDLAVL